MSDVRDWVSVKVNGKEENEWGEKAPAEKLSTLKRRPQVEKNTQEILDKFSVQLAVCV